MYNTTHTVNKKIKPFAFVLRLEILKPYSLTMVHRINKKILQLSEHPNSTLLPCLQEDEGESKNLKIPFN